MKWWPAVSGRKWRVQPQVPPVEPFIAPQDGQLGRDHQSLAPHHQPLHPQPGLGSGPGQGGGGDPAKVCNSSVDCGPGLETKISRNTGYLSPTPGHGPEERPSLRLLNPFPSLEIGCNLISSSPLDKMLGNRTEVVQCNTFSWNWETLSGNLHTL